MRRGTTLRYGLLLGIGLGCGRSPTGQATAAPSTSSLAAPESEAAAPLTALAGATSAALPATVLDAAGGAVSTAAMVRVQNIGMHIGGGPNDALTKAPIAGSVAPHFQELRACWAQVADPSRGGDFGIDLLIPAEGGRAAVSHPRTGLAPDAFRDCVVAVFTAVDFAKPRTGRTTVSYSLRFAPEGASSQGAR